MMILLKIRKKIHTKHLQLCTRIYTIHHQLQNTNTTHDIRDIMRSVYNSMHCTSAKTTNKGSSSTYTHKMSMMNAENNMF